MPTRAARSSAIETLLFSGTSPHPTSWHEMFRYWKPSLDLARLSLETRMQQQALSATTLQRYEKAAVCLRAWCDVPVCAARCIHLIAQMFFSTPGRRAPPARRPPFSFSLLVAVSPTHPAEAGRTKPFRPRVDGGSPADQLTRDRHGSRPPRRRRDFWEHRGLLG